jgi:predicted nucleic acid-binding protein
VILVDTTVLINYLKGAENKKTLLFESVLKHNLPYGISPYTYQELLQGARDEKEYRVLKNYLSTQITVFLPSDIKTYEEAAELYYKLRRQGVTPRSAIDVLIALTAIKNKMPLLHDDRDFDAIAAKTKDLQILEGVYA